MKHLASIFTFAFVLHLSAPAAEVVVYSPASDQPLHVSGGDVSRTFPPSYNGHRSVCVVPDASTNDDFVAWSGGDTYAPGDPFGVSAGRDYPTIELTRTTSIMPRINVFANASDRLNVFGDASLATTDFVNFVELPASEKVRVRVVRARIDNLDPFMAGVRDPKVLVDRVFQSDVKNVLHEGDFLADGALDLDWDKLYDEVVDAYGIIATGTPITNVNYLVVFGDGSLEFSNVTSNTNNLHAHPILVDRRYEVYRTRPTATGAKVRENSVELNWQIVGEDPWASRFGTTYTAYKVDAWLGGTTNGPVWRTSGVRRMPPADSRGTYRHVIDNVPNDTNLTWQVFTFNSKFKFDWVETPHPNIKQYGGSDPQTVTISH